MRSKLKAMICLTVIISVLIGVFPAYAAVTDVDSVNKMLSLIDNQNFNGTTSISDVKNYINHFTYNSKFAAFYGKQFNYPNSSKEYFYNISDGTYTKNVGGAKGCYAHSKFVSIVVYGKNGSKKFHTEKAKKLTGAGLKSFLLSEAQAGEHLRIDSKHSVVFISGDNNGFYYFSYNGDDYGKKILLVYKTYADFASKYNNVPSSEKSSIWLYNANTNTNSGNVNNSSNNTNNINDTANNSNNNKPKNEPSSVKILPNSYPSGNLKYGKDFTLTAKFTSDCAIVEARAYMLDSNKNVVMQAKGSSTTSNYYVEGYALDKGMKFDELTPGGYYLKYFVKDANGDTADWTSNKFYIVKESSSNKNSNNTNTNNSSSSKTISDGVYVIATKLNTNYVLDISDASKDNGANLQLWKSNKTAAQTFKVTHIGNGCYQIVNTNSGKAIDAQNGDTSAGTNVWQYQVNNTDAQIWKIVDAGSGYYHVICKKSGLYLDLNNANVVSGENIKLWTNNGNDAQKWKFTKSSSKNSSSSSSSASKPSSSKDKTPTTSIRFELETIPKGNLPYGKSFSLKGWFRSDCAIVEARAYMLDSNKNVVMQSDKASSTTSNYKIQGYKLDKAMKFNKLSPGGYYLKYYVKDANGDTATWISDKFYIVK